MEIQTLGDAIRRARNILQLTQRELARLCETTRDLISKWECDARPIEDSAWRRLARALKLPFSLLHKLAVDITMGGEIASLLNPRRYAYSPPRDRKTAIRLLAFRRVDKSFFAELWQFLKNRDDWLRVRRFLLTAWADGRYEVEAWMRLLHYGLTAEWASPLRCGYRILPFVDPRDRRYVGDCRMPALVAYGERPTVIFPQATLLAGNEVPRPDALVGMRAHGRTRWCGYEIERKGLPSELDRRERSEQLRMPILYFTADDVRRPDFPETLLRRVYETLWPTEGK